MLIGTTSTNRLDVILLLEIDESFSNILSAHR